MQKRAFKLSVVCVSAGMALALTGIASERRRGWRRGQLR